MSGIPEDIPAFGGESQPYTPDNIEKVFEHLPITIHVGDHIRGPKTIIGWSNAWRDRDTGETTIMMTLDEEASEKLGNLTELFRLYAIGFAGFARSPEKSA
jgi:hypothetical protein